MRRQLLSILCLSVSTAASAAAQDSSATNGKSVWQGVYTEAQAARGDSEHQNNCSACHGTEKYAGEAFTKAFFGRTVFDLFDQIKTTMPDDNPGGLQVQQYLDVVAYILKINGMPAGTDSLSSDPEALRRIKIEAKPDKQTALWHSVPGGSSVTHLRSASLRPMYHPHASALGTSPTATR